VIAGGAEDDVIFGELGDDWIQGDGSAIDETGAVTVDVVGTRASVEDWAGIGRDGRDWIEGNGGDDTMFGNLGQDDLIGGSSSLYSLTAPTMRPGGADTIFGGAGVRLVRNDFGDLDPDGHAHDADVIMGDNADVFRLVGVNGTPSSPSTFLTFNYDNGPGAERIIPRAYTFVDYTQGGAASDLGAADLIHGEAGDDTIHGMVGNDVLFGEGQDDDIYGGTGFDRIYGGTGQDGILGDDGKIYTSRNGLTEPLNRRTTPNLEETVELNGPFTGGVVAIAGELKKEALLAAWIPSSTSGACPTALYGCNDVIYGGLGDDFIHSGAGDDAVSGAEALREFYNEAPQVDPDPLRYDPVTTKFAQYDADDPWSKIPGFLLNFDAYRINDATGQPVDVGGELVKSDDGRDRIFGDNGNDWLVGGTNCDWLFGGWGDDLMNLDDNLDTDGGRNDRPEDDVRFRDGDFAFGGAGRDVLIANTAQDRMFDWHGEFNSYIVPFAPFGIPTVNRLFSPDVRELMRELAYAAGVDRTLTPSEPYDEIALVEPKDKEYNDQTGGPRDPQPGHIAGVQRDPVGGKNLHCPCDVTPLVHVSKFISTVDGTIQHVSDEAGVDVVLPVGTPVYWTYEVTNLSVIAQPVENVPLQITRISDDFGSPANAADDFVPVYLSGDTNGDGLLDIGETWIFTSQGVVGYAAQLGVYANTVTVEAEARTQTGGSTADTATNRHTGSPLGIAIKKAVNAVDPLNPTVAEEADTPTGAVLAVGSTSTWTYRVTNVAATAIATVAVTDDNGTPDVGADDFSPTFVSGDTNGNGALDPGETWLYRATGIVVVGQYGNTAKATGMQGTTPLAATDKAYYVGTTGIRIVKLANGDDANAAPGIVLSVGAPVVYTYQVIGSSAVPLTNVVVADDNGTPGVTGDDFSPRFVSGDANGNGLLDFGETWLFTSQGVVGSRSTVANGTVVNTATVTASNGGATPVSASDVAYVTGQTATLKLVKAINALDPAHPQPDEDANTAPGRSVVIGSTVTFTYAVSVSGMSTATNVVVTDDKLPTIAAVTVTGGFNVGDSDRDRALDPGEIWIFRATATALAGLQTNTAGATATDAVAGTALTATDLARYTGVPGSGTTPTLSIDKSVNPVNAASPTAAEDANDSRSPVLLAAGAPVTWKYAVRTTLDVGSVVVTDDNGTTANPSDDFAPTLVSGDNNHNNILDKNETWIYQGTGTVPTGLFTNVARATGVAGGTTYADDDRASIFGWTVDVDVRKATNAIDPRNPTPAEEGDSAPGQIVPVGTPIVWTYLVTNNGNIGVTVGLSDDFGTAATADDFVPRYVSGDTNGNGKVDRGETWLFTSTNVVTYSARAGQYVNAVTVTTRAPDASTLTSRDRSFHFGATGPMELVKSVNPVDPMAPTPYEDADTAPGVILTVGTPVRWSYVLRNTGNFALAVIGVQDDNGGGPDAVGFAPDPVNDAQGFNVGDVDKNGLLDPHESWLFQSDGTHTVALGAHVNTATAFAVFHGATPPTQVTAVDLANVLGVPTTPSISITKAVNGIAADSPADAVYVPASASVTWTYVVTNGTTGSATPVSIANVVVTDDNGTQGVTSDDFSPTPTGGDVNANGLLDPGETWTYTHSAVLPAGLHGNVARAVGAAAGVTIADDDLAYAFGVDAKVTITKALNALNPLAPTSLEDATTGTTPELFATGTVVFTYLVRNTGNVPLFVNKTNGIVDDHGTPGVTADDFNAGYVSGDADGDGLLDLDETWLFRSATLTVQAGAYTNTATVTATEPKAGQSASAADIARYFGRMGAEGHTPGFWKTNVDTKNAVAWPRQNDGSLVLDPLQPVSSLFSGLPANLANLSLADGLGLGGGGIEALLRHAISGVLSAIHPYVAFPLSALEIVALTNAAIASGNASTIDALKNRFQSYNELGADLDANGNVPAPRLAVTGASVTEGNTGTSTVLVTIGLTGPALGTVTVSWATSNGTATAVSDYTAASGTVTFVRGDMVKTVPITIVGDTVNEPNETFAVQLSNPTGATIATASANVTILNDDSALTAAAVAPSARSTGTLNAADAELALVAALTVWSQAGAETSALAGVTIAIVDLPGAQLGEADGTAVLVDIDAAGYGWFVDATPSDDAEYAIGSGGEGRADVASAAAGRMDLLTVVVHELGHRLGLGHVVATAAGDVMEPTLAPGVRRLPTLAARSSPVIHKAAPIETPAPRAEPAATSEVALATARSSQWLGLDGPAGTRTRGPGFESGWSGVLMSLRWERPRSRARENAQLKSALEANRRKAQHARQRLLMPVRENRRVVLMRAGCDEEIGNGHTMLALRGELPLGRASDRDLRIRA
jgi:hypothetical protein